MFPLGFVERLDVDCGVSVSWIVVMAARNRVDRSWTSALRRPFLILASMKKLSWIVVGYLSGRESLNPNLWIGNGDLVFFLRIFPHVHGDSLYFFNHVTLCIWWFGFGVILRFIIFWDRLSARAGVRFGCLADGTDVK